MSNLDLFGGIVIPESRKEYLKRRKTELRNATGGLRINPMIAMFGETPEKKCKTCTWLYYKQFANKYWKCQYRNNTAGPASDHRVSWPACGKHKEKPLSPAD